jgi:hypothetical protein
MTCVGGDKDVTFDDRFAKAFADSICDRISFAQDSHKTTIVSGETTKDTAKTKR